MKYYLLGILTVFVLNVHSQALKQLSPDLYPQLNLTKDGRDSIRAAAQLYRQASEKMNNKLPLSKAESAIIDKIDQTGDASLDMFLEKGCYYYVGSGYGCCYYENGGPDSVWSTASVPGYSAQKVADETLDSAWAVGKEAIGQSLFFRMVEHAWPLETIIIYNGFQKDIGIWRRNNRVKQFRLYVDGRAVALLNMEDVTNGQLFDVRQWFPQRQAPYVIRLEILSIYKGETHDDTVVSEIIFDGPIRH